ncbi:hypothetical protein VaNZ11_015443 [Volvox africanus]|uniref:Autophagy-related protein 9 n=1 Tax=Volvox africanus TaxID=51714 RepID=A0ABQ5SM69_9CHLO|nr:hypothetical protein VaNZ11_015443 [Volvox africanus]
MRLNREQEQELSNGFNDVYALSSVAEMDDEAGLHLEMPLLVGGESYEFAAIANLDLFFTRVYRYWHEHGFTSILLAGALNLLALVFTAAFSIFLLLFVDWRALHAECIAPRAGGGSGDCDLAAVALDRRPLLGRGVAADLLAVSYISMCVVYLGWTAAHYVMDARDMREVAHFMSKKLGIDESKVVTMTWAEVVYQLVLVQRTTRLCIARDLDELHIVSRIMRKDNYLIAMINRNVLQLHLQTPPDAPLLVRRVMDAMLLLMGGGGSGSGCGGSSGCPPMLTKTLEWNLRWCILDYMFDDQFRIRPGFSDVAALKRRLRLVAAANLLLSPFLLMFLLAYFFMRNAERLYHHPAALGSRRWSGLAKWKIRELNELPHYLKHRLSASHPAALRYVAQFPSHTLAALARFMVFATGSFVALLLLMTFLDESLLERPLLGRQVVWWLGTMTVVLAACRTLVSEEPVAYDPERALADVVSFTHYLPQRWRSRAHTAEVQGAFLSLFRLKVVLFLEELASLVTTPLVLACSLPACAESIVEFVSTFTAHVDGVGDVCSMAMFDLARHGDTNYGAPVQAEEAFRSCQGKLEKSFLTFVATYPTWEPGGLGRRMLEALAASSRAVGAAAGGSGGTDSSTAAALAAVDTRVASMAPAEGSERAPRPATDAQPFHQDEPTVFPYQAAAGVDNNSDLAPAGSTAALTRAASGFRSHGKGITSSAPPGDDGDGRKGNLYVGGEGGDVTSQTTVQAVIPEPGSVPARAAQHGGLRGVRRPQVPLHLQPHHGVRSYMSNASGSQLSAGALGWPWRQPAHLSTGAAAGTAGGSPAPSVASSQFSNLAAPYLQYYPVPLFYAQKQQLRHVRQQQYPRMYEQLMYGGLSLRRDPASMGSGATEGLPPSPISLPHDRRIANSSASVGGGGGMAWQHHSSIPPFDVCGSYSGLHYPVHFCGSPIMPSMHTPAVPPLHQHPQPHPHAYPNPRSGQMHGTTTAYASATDAGPAVPIADDSRRPRGHSQPSCDGDIAAAGQPPSGGTSGVDETSGRGATATIAAAAAAAAAQSATQPAWPVRYMAGMASGKFGSESMELRSVTSPIYVMGDGACQGNERKPSPTCGGGVTSGSSSGPETVRDGWGSGVSDPTGVAKSIVAATGSMATALAAEAEQAEGAPAAAATVATCGGTGGESGSRSVAASGSAGASTSAHIAGSGSATTAAGCGSDILDLRGLDMTPAASADDDEDEALGMGDFVKLLQTGPGPGAEAVSALGTEANCLELGLLEDADGFGLVPGAAPPSRPLHVMPMVHQQQRQQPAASGPGSGSGSVSALMPRRWGPNVGSTHVSGTLQHSSAPQQLNDDDGAASGAWYDRVALPNALRQHQQHSSSNPVMSSQLPELRPSECAQRSLQGQEGDAACSQIYDCADYYVTSPYDGIDEYAMYGGASSLYVSGGVAAGTVDYAAVMDSSLHPPWQLQLQPDGVQYPHQSPLQIRLIQGMQQQQLNDEAGRQMRAASVSHLPVAELSAASLRVSVFGGGGETIDTADADVRLMGANAALQQSRLLQASQSHSHVPGGVLPLNETSELRDRIAHGHSLLQHLYDSKHPSVHHRLPH